MKRKLFLLIVVSLFLGLGVVAYAVSSSGTNSVAGCCGKGDSCPMKSKDGKSMAEGHECCCKDGAESCPMKSKDAKSGDKMAMSADGEHSCDMMKKDGAMAEHHKKMADGKMADGESCPMMNAGGHKMGEGMKHDMKAGDGPHKMAMNHDMKTADGKGHSCPCCNAAGKKAEAPKQ